jgi:hypothetical protein
MYLSINQCCRTYHCAFFHSGDPDQVVPFVLYTAPLYTHTSAAAHASHSLFRLRKWYFRSTVAVYTALAMYNLTSAFPFRFRWEINKPFFTFILSAGVGRSYYSTQFLNMYSLPVFPYFVLHSFRPWVDIQLSSHFSWSGCLYPNTV